MSGFLVTNPNSLFMGSCTIAFCFHCYGQHSSNKLKEFIIILCFSEELLFNWELQFFSKLYFLQLNSRKSNSLSIFNLSLGEFLLLIYVNVVGLTSYRLTMCSYFCLPGPIYTFSLSFLSPPAPVYTLWVHVLGPLGALSGVLFVWTKLKTRTLGCQLVNLKLHCISIRSARYWRHLMS